MSSTRSQAPSRFQGYLASSPNPQATQLYFLQVKPRSRTLFLGPLFCLCNFFMQRAEMDMAEWELVDDRFFFHPDGIVDMKYFNPITNSSNPKEPNKEAEVMEEAKEKVEPCNLAGDQDLVSQVFFNKVNKNEYVDMKIGSPPRTPTKEMKPQLDLALIRFEEEKNSNTKLVDDGCEPQEEEEEEESNGSEEKQEKWWWEGGVLTIWKWKIHGVGALCSVGVAAAATVFIFFVGSRHRHKRLQNQRPRFQIYPEDKRIQQVVHQASRLNQALLTRATINFGGHFDAL